MNSKRFAAIWYTVLFCILLGACAALIGYRDTPYQGDKDAVPQTNEQGEWWAATKMLRTASGRQWCSAVAVSTGYDSKTETHTNPDGTKTSSTYIIPITWLVTARHCTNKMTEGTASHVMYNSDGTVLAEMQYKVLEYFNHPTKDFAILMVEEHMKFLTPIYRGELPNDRQDFIIGYRGSGHGNKHQYGKYISPAYAYKGQSGGGVFSPGLGLHAIVSTHVDGVNIWKALQEMNMEHVSDR